MTVKYHFSPLYLAVLVAFGATAESSQSSDIVVTANRTASQISDIPATVLIVEGDDLRAQINAGVDYKDALAQLIPSLDVGSQSRTNAGQQMRGREILVMLDGVSLNSSRGISRQFESIDPFNIDRIEVISGATAIYGGGSTGGIINIITKKGEAGPATVSLYTGGKSGLQSSDDFDGNLATAITGGNEKADYRVSMAYTQTQAAYNAKGNKILPDITQTSSQYSKQIDLMGTAGVNMDDNQRVDFTAQYFDNQQDSDSGAYFGPMFAGFVDPSQISVKDGLSLADQPATQRTYLAAKYAHQAFLGQQLFLQAYYRDEEMQFYPFPRINTRAPQLSSISASTQKTNVLGFKGVMTSELEPLDTQLVYGLDAERENFTSHVQYHDFRQAAASGGLVYNPLFQTGRYPELDIDQVALFLQSTSQINDQWSVNGGVRYQYSNTQVDDFVGLTQQYLIATGMYPSADVVPGGEADYGVWLFNLGTLYDINKSNQVYANLSQGFDIPDPAKYYGNGTYNMGGVGPTLEQGISVANNKAKGIETNSIELGWRHNADALSTQVATYYSISDKKISYDAKSLAVKEVDEDKRVYGIEAAADYLLAPQWFIGGLGHLVKADKKVNGDWQKLEASFASNSKLNGYIAWAPNDLNLRLQGTHVFDYKDDQSNQLDGYFLADLLGAYTLPVGQVNFGINNLFDKDYQTIWSQRAQLTYAGITTPAVVTFEGRGRTYGVSYSVDF